MTPEQVAASYDRIADQWVDVSTYGFAQVERAVAFVKRKGVALDVGCGTGRLTGLLNKHGFRTDGLDVSSANLGGAYAQGIFIAQDGRNITPSERQNFKFVAWAKIASAMKLQ